MFPNKKLTKYSTFSFQVYLPINLNVAQNLMKCSFAKIKILINHFQELQKALQFKIHILPFFYVFKKIHQIISKFIKPSTFDFTLKTKNEKTEKTV